MIILLIISPIKYKSVKIRAIKKLDIVFIQMYVCAVTKPMKLSNVSSSTNIGSGASGLQPLKHVTEPMKLSNVSSSTNIRSGASGLQPLKHILVILQNLIPPIRSYTLSMFYLVNGSKVVS